MDFFYGGRRAARVFGVLRVRRMVDRGRFGRFGGFVSGNAGLRLGHADRYVYVFHRLDYIAAGVKRLAKRAAETNKLKV